MSHKVQYTANWRNKKVTKWKS